MIKKFFIYAIYFMASVCLIFSIYIGIIISRENVIIVTTKPDQVTPAKLSILISRDNLLPKTQIFFADEMELGDSFDMAFHKTINNAFRN
jgi:hypothetical protein